MSTLSRDTRLPFPARHDAVDARPVSVATSVGVVDVNIRGAAQRGRCRVIITSLIVSSTAVYGVNNVLQVERLRPVVLAQVYPTGLIPSSTALVMVSSD